MFLSQSRTPEGMRLYAIGDVHGLDAELADMHDRIAADLAERPAPDHRVIHVGDYVDRGPDSAGVVARLARLTAEDGHVVCLRGNHDALLTGFLDEPAKSGQMWLDNGGDATLRSYGVTPGRSFLGGYDFAKLSRQFAEKIPAADRAFLEGLPVAARLGDYFFCHAGIRPGVPLDRQDENDLIWIREEFLWDERDHGVVVVHGHTPKNPREVRPNRINVDTGAVFGGPLTCVVLDGTDYRFL